MSVLLINCRNAVLGKMESGNKNHNGEISLKQDALIMQNVQDFAVPKGRDKSEIWAAIESRIRQVNEGKVRKLSNSWMRYGIAASVILVIGVVYILSIFSGTSVETSPGEMLSFYLPDGSKVYLNESSSISYDIDDWERQRLVNLDGEAYFEVKKGETFSVVSETGIVEVLGTSFNVFAREDQYVVDCMTGRVKVSNPEFDNFQILTPGLSSIIKNNQVLFMTRNKNESIGEWRIEEYAYEDVALTKVMQDLEKQYNIKFEYDIPVEQRRYTGFFNNKNLEESLEKVFPPMGLSFQEISEGEFRITDDTTDL